jgi:hypothetical protein
MLGVRRTRLLSFGTTGLLYGYEMVLCGCWLLLYMRFGGYGSRWVELWRESFFTRRVSCDGQVSSCVLV